jgi:hypothetical protein
MFSLQSVLQISKEMYISRGIVELGLATIYTYHISIILHTHAHLDSLDPLFDFVIHEKVCLQLLLCFLHSYELHISFSCRKGKA